MQVPGTKDVPERPRVYMLPIVMQTYTLKNVDMVPYIIHQFALLNLRKGIILSGNRGNHIN